MKIINTIFVYTLIFLLLNCLVESRIEKKVKANNLKKVKTRKVSTSLTSKNNIDTTPTPTMTIPEPTPITDPKGTVFYQFALGASNILVSDPEAASECQLQDWMVDQPSIQAGTAQWFEELTDPLVELKGLLDVYALQNVCTKYPEKLKGWLANGLEQENTRFQADLKSNKTHSNVDYPDPYGPQEKAKKDKKSKKEVKAAKTQPKLFVQNEKSKTKDWWAVLSLSLPLVPFHILKYKHTLDKMLKGFIFIHFNKFLDCIAMSADTNRSINDRIVGYRSLMTYSKNGKTMNEFGNVFSLFLFLQLILTV